jgi:hypothetical protein
MKAGWDIFSHNWDDWKGIWLWQFWDSKRKAEIGKAENRNQDYGLQDYRTTGKRRAEDGAGMLANPWLHQASGSGKA